MALRQTSGPRLRERISLSEDSIARAFTRKFGRTLRYDHEIVRMVLQPLETGKGRAGISFCAGADATTLKWQEGLLQGRLYCWCGTVGGG
jgi:hypothetical protein